MRKQRFPWAWLLIWLMVAVMLALNICYTHAIWGSNLPTWAKFLLLHG